jgi:hypothetical protein
MVCLEKRPIAVLAAPLLPVASTASIANGNLAVVLMA